MFRLFASGCVLVLAALSGGPVAADDKKDKTAVTWVRDAGEFKLTFELGKDTGKYTIAFGENACVITSKLKFEKDEVTSEVTGVEVKGTIPNPPKKGDKISFKWVVKDGVATLTELTGDGTEEVKSVIQGEYKKK